MYAQVYAFVDKECMFMLECDCLFFFNAGSINMCWWYVWCDSILLLYVCGLLTIVCICPLIFVGKNMNNMENGPFTDDFPIRTSIYNGFSQFAMLKKPDGTPKYGTCSHQHDSFDRECVRVGSLESKFRYGNLGTTLLQLVLSFMDAHRQNMMCFNHVEWVCSTTRIHILYA